MYVCIGIGYMGPASVCMNVRMNVQMNEKMNILMNVYMYEHR